jgi:hypothetical protein
MPLVVCYRIKDWASRFENNRSRELKNLDWFACPNSLDGDGYTELIEFEDGAASYGCFITLCAIASRCEPRGTLVRDSGKPHDVASLARLTRIPRDTVDAAINHLLGVGWLIAEEVEVNLAESHPPAGMSHDDASLRGRARSTEGKEGNGRKIAQAALACARDDATLGGAAETQPSSLKSDTPTQPDDVAAKQPRALKSVQRRSPNGDETQAPQGFEHFWKNWPSHHRKVGKSKCLRAWRKLGLERVSESVLHALARSKASPDWQRDGGRFVPQPLSWLNDTPWETDDSEATAPDPETAHYRDPPAAEIDAVLNSSSGGLT